MSDIANAIRPGHSEPNPRRLLIWRILAPVTYVVFVVTATWHTFVRPGDRHHHHAHYHTIWGQNHHKTPFALNAIITSIYWIVLWVLQLVYVANLFTPASLLAPAAALAPSFVAHNVLSSMFVGLWTRSQFWWALLVAIINWLQLTFAYFRYPRHPALMHISTLAGPLAFSFVALFWDGAAAFNGTSIAARIVANVFIWSWLVYGAFYLTVFKDWAVGGALSVLTASLGVGQFVTHTVALQWIFAFTIMALLFLASLVVAFPDASGFTFKRGAVVSEDRERAPLLADETV